MLRRGPKAVRAWMHGRRGKGKERYPKAKQRTGIYFCGISGTQREGTRAQDNEHGTFLSTTYERRRYLLEEITRREALCVWQGETGLLIHRHHTLTTLPSSAPALLAFPIHPCPLPPLQIPLSILMHAMHITRVAEAGTIGLLASSVLLSSPPILVHEVGKGVIRNSNNDCSRRSRRSCCSGRSRCSSCSCCSWRGWWSRRLRTVRAFEGGLGDR